MKNWRFGHRLMRRLHYIAQWRCAEPIVIVESDDWGLPRKASSAQVSGFGMPDEWADEELETENDLGQLYSVLEQAGSQPDHQGNRRPPCFVANFVTAHPDYEAIHSSAYATYHDTPINLSCSQALRQKWRQGMERQVFFPQYHARAHFAPARWLQDLQAYAPGARH